MSAKPTKTTCAICANLVAPAHAPFCSQGCRDRDLLQWFGEGYRIPAPAEDPDDGLDGGLDMGDRSPL